MIDDFNDEVPEPEQDIFSQETMEEIILAKENNKNAFQSYWEMDENDIEDWTKKDIDSDPGKQLLVSAEGGELDNVKQLLTQLPDDASREKLLRYKDSDGYTALHRACYSNRIEVVRYLVSFENNINMPNLNQLNVKTDMGWTPLHSASYWNSFDSVKHLLYYANCDVNQQSNSGQTSLHLAAQQSTGRETILLLLTHPNLKHNLKNDQKETALELAKRSCKYNALFEITEDYLNLLI